MHCRLPHSIASVRQLGMAASSVLDMASQLPASRWEPSPDGIVGSGNQVYTVAAADLFDNRHFSMATAEASATDPQQRLVLETCGTTMHHAALTQVPQSRNVGVAVGIHSIEWKQVCFNIPAGRTVFAGFYGLHFVSGRVSYALGLQGPSTSIDAACAASLVTCHAATRALQYGECDSHLAVGINLCLIQSVSIALVAAGMCSVKGRCHTFDSRADGYARSEGCAMVLLHPSQATFEVKGSAVRADGRSASLTAPNGLAQQGLIKATLADAATAADDLHMNEAHGTGTQLGDPIEVSSLARSVLARRARVPVLALGSIKGNIGHIETGAGTTGILHLAGCLGEGRASPNAQLRVLNPHILTNLAPDERCSMQVQARPLASSGMASKPARVSLGGISSFGVSGTIAHIVLGHAWCSMPTAGGPLLYKRQSFLWCTSAPPKTVSMQERAVASEAALHSLDNALKARRMTSIPSQAEVTIVGAGLSGLTVAAGFATVGAHPLAVIEKSASAAGVWRHQGNAFSRVNSSEPSYRMPVSYETPNTNHSFHGEILHDALRTIKQHCLAAHIHVLAEVCCVSSAGTTGWLVSGRRKEGRFVLQCGLVVLCTNRRLGIPRHLAYQGEELFVRAGSLHRGLGGDVNSLKCAGKRVAILGMGAFAIENMRTSFERSAASVIILCRRRGTACPQIVDWVNFIRPFDDEGKHGAAGDSLVLYNWTRIYDQVHATRPECWVEGILKPDGHTVSTSDMFFLAHHLHMLTTMLGEVGHLSERLAVTRAGEPLEADVLIKCVGFEINEGCERLVGRAGMAANAQIACNLWLQVEPHLDSRTFNNPFGSSYVNATAFKAGVIVRSWQAPEIPLRLAQADFEYSRINRHHAREGIESGALSAAIDPEISWMLRRHVGSVAAACHASLPPAQYIEQNEVLWKATYDLLLCQASVSTETAMLPYPFASLFADLPDIETNNEPETRASKAKTAAVALSLDDVLKIAQSVSGSAYVDPDTPLEDSRFDSISAVEFAAQLEAASGGPFSPVLMFEAPTPRLIANVLGRELINAANPTTTPAGHSNGGWALTDSGVRLLRPPSAWSPWVFIPGIFGDVGATFEELLPLLEINGDGAIGVDFTSEVLSLCDSWSELIDQYAKLVNQQLHFHTSSEQPLTLKLVGYSFGCRIAYAVCRLLVDAGHSVRLLLIDGPIGGPIGSFEESIRAQAPQSISGRLVALLALGGDGPILEHTAVDAFVASEAQVGVEVLQEASPTTTIVQASGSHQKVLRSPNVATVAAVLAPFVTTKSSLIAEPPPPALSSYSFPIQTSSEDCQAWFDRGCVWAYGFHKQEANYCFKQASKFDPKCAMAFWAIAWTNTQDYNFHAGNGFYALAAQPAPGFPSFGAAKDAIDAAMALLNDCSPPRERGLIEAMQKMIAWPVTEETHALYEAYAVAMEELGCQDAFVDDAEVQALCAEALMGLAPWALWGKDRKTPLPVGLRVKAALDRGLAAAPGHPFLCHLKIHYDEMGPIGAFDWVSAEALRSTDATAMGHLLHMPTHLDIQVGEYARAIASNEAGIAADKALFAVAPERFGNYFGYAEHNMEFVVWAAMYAGIRAKVCVCRRRCRRCRCCCRSRFYCRCPCRHVCSDLMCVRACVCMCVPCPEPGVGGRVLL